METKYYQYINGKLVEGEGELMEVYNPNTGELVGSYKAASVEQVEEALQAAQEAFKTWQYTSINERNAWMKKLKDACMAPGKREELLDLLFAEAGKSYNDNVGDYDRCWDYYEYYCEEVKRFLDSGIPDFNSHRDRMYRVMRRPIGVVVGHLAWNVPIINLGLKLGPVMATGNTCVLKPSTSTPLTTMKIAEVAAEIGMPAGVFNLVSGKSSVIGKYMNESKIPSIITCIGSVPTGVQIMGQASTSIKKLGLELGGNAPCIIMPDADLDKAVAFISTRKVSQVGQSCGCVNRIFVHEDVHDAFVEKLVAKVSSFKIGPSKEEPGNIGALIDVKSRDRLLQIVNEAVADGAKVLYGGTIPELDPKYNGGFMVPTIVDGVKDEMRIAAEELFGPVYPILTFTDVDDVIERSNSTEFGLSSYAFTYDAKAIGKFFERLDFGRVCINNAPIAGANMPHTGHKQSGLGSAYGRESLENYYSVKLASIDFN